jgi:hypothetical protein
MQSNPRFVSTNKKWALGPILFFNPIILANFPFKSKTLSYEHLCAGSDNPFDSGRFLCIEINNGYYRYLGLSSCPRVG